jgi:hypothetical protein
MAMGGGVDRSNLLVGSMVDQKKDRNTELITGCNLVSDQRLWVRKILI